MRIESKKRIDVVALLTCYNRRDYTVSCLDSFFQQTAEISKAAVLVDDGSSDGTSGTVREHFSSVTIVAGSGSLFWGGGMRLAAATAMAEFNASFHLWLNDDVVLDPDSLGLLIRTFQERKRINRRRSIIVGGLRDPQTGATSYSGLERASSLHRLRFKLVDPDGSPRSCDTMNGNVVLMPAGALHELGPIDPLFTHNMGDTDYGLRAVGSGWEIVVAPEYVGTCAPNPPSGTFAEPGLSLLRRFKHLRSPKGLPFRAWVAYARRHGGRLWPGYVALPYLGMLLSNLPFVRRRYLRRKGFSTAR